MAICGTYHLSPATNSPPWEVPFHLLEHEERCKHYRIQKSRFLFQTRLLGATLVTAISYQLTSPANKMCLA